MMYPDQWHGGNADILGGNDQGVLACIQRQWRETVLTVHLHDSRRQLLDFRYGVAVDATAF